MDAQKAPVIRFQKKLLFKGASFFTFFRNSCFRIICDRLLRLERVGGSIKFWRN